MTTTITTTKTWTTTMETTMTTSSELKERTNPTSMSTTTSTRSRTTAQSRTNNFHNGETCIQRQRRLNQRKEEGEKGQDHWGALLLHDALRGRQGCPRTQGIGTLRNCRIGNWSSQTTIEMHENCRNMLTKRCTMPLDHVGRCRTKANRAIAHCRKHHLLINFKITVYNLTEESSSRNNQRYIVDWAAMETMKQRVQTTTRLQINNQTTVLLVKLPLHREWSRLDMGQMKLSDRKGLFERIHVATRQNWTRRMYCPLTINEMYASGRVSRFRMQL